MMVLLQAMQGLGAPGRSIWGTTMGAPSDTTHLGAGLRRAEWPMSHLHLGRRLHPRQPNQATAVAPHRARRHPRPAGELVRRRLLRPESLEQQFTHFDLSDGGLLRDQAVVPLRRVLHGHHERHHQMGAHVPEPQAGVRGQPGRLVQQRDPHGRCHPAGLHQLRARRHGRMGRRQRLHRGTPAAGCNYRVVVREQKCIEPLWESKSDYEIFALHLREDGPAATSSPTARPRWTGSRPSSTSPTCPRTISWEEFNRKGYHIININDDYKPTPGLRWFYEGRACDTPDLRQPQAAYRQGAGTGHLQRQNRVRRPRA